MSISRLVSVVSRHWLLVAVLTAAFLAGAAAISYTTVASYRASALLQVQTPVDPTGAVSLNDTLSARERAVTITTLGNTDEVTKLAEKSIPVTRGLSSCSFSQVGQSEFLTATCTGTAKGVVAGAANAYADALQGLLETQRQTRVGELAAAYRAQIATLRSQGVPTTAYPTPPAYPNYRELEIIDAAVTPKVPFAPRPTRTLAIALVLGLIVNVGLAFLLDHLQNRARTPEELGRALGEPVLVAIPRLGKVSRSAQTTFLVPARRPQAEGARAGAKGGT